MNQPKLISNRDHVKSIIDAADDEAKAHGFGANVWDLIYNRFIALLDAKDRNFAAIAKRNIELMYPNTDN